MDVNRERRELLNRLPITSSAVDEGVAEISGRLNSAVHGWLARFEEVYSPGPIDIMELSWDAIERLRAERLELVHGLWLDLLLLLGERLQAHGQIVAILDEAITDATGQLEKARAEARKLLEKAGLAAADLNRAIEETSGVRQAREAKAMAQNCRREMEREIGMNLDRHAVETLRKDITADFAKWISGHIGLFTVEARPEQRPVNLWNRTAKQPDVYDPEIYRRDAGPVEDPAVIEKRLAKSKGAHPPIPAMTGFGQ